MAAAEAALRARNLVIPARISLNACRETAYYPRATQAPYGMSAVIASIVRGDCLHGVVQSG